MDRHSVNIQAYAQKEVRSAAFSECRTYRYALWRIWDESKPAVLFIGLNPSTADETADDPTIRRCRGFAQAWGFGGICVANLFALRTAHPGELKTHPSPVGPDNDRWLVRLGQKSGIVLAAWGNHGSLGGRDREVARLAPQLQCLGVTKAGHPRHPLYFKAAVEPIPLAMPNMQRSTAHR